MSNDLKVGDRVRVTGVYVTKVWKLEVVSDG